MRPRPDASVGGFQGGVIYLSENSKQRDTAHGQQSQFPHMVGFAFVAVRQVHRPSLFQSSSVSTIYLFKHDDET